MNILYITQRVPYPPNRGDKIASYNAIRHLARRHTVTVAALAESEEELGHAEELRRQGFTVEVALHSHYQAKLGAVRAIPRGIPLSVGYYRSRELASKITALAGKVKFDVLVAFSSSMGQYADCVPQTPLVADFVDMDSRKWELCAAHAQWPRSSIYAMEERRLLQYERSLAQRAACSIVRTEAERADCLRLIPGSRFEVVSNGVDLDHFHPFPGAKVFPNAVFTGIMDYFPNVQGAQYFCERVLPLVRREVPDATFTIVGARPQPSVLRLRRLEGVAVTGQVPDVRPYLANAAVAVAPLVVARGIQNKILEAMAMGKPVVATRAALRGVDAPEGEGILGAATPEEFAAQVTKLLRDPRLGEEIGSRGRRLVERRYVWDEQLAHLETLLHEVAALPSRTPRAAEREAVGTLRPTW
jgi:sugar transferase (PEP-CTERM/EpsH1 system associated)